MRVAVTLFCEAEGVDEMDAAAHATRAIRQALAGSPIARLPLTLPSVVAYPGRSGEHVFEPVVVHQVMDAGMAAGNGYLWLRPTSKAFREGD